MFIRGRGRENCGHFSCGKSKIENDEIDGRSIDLKMIRL